MADALVSRNSLSEAFFSRESHRLAIASKEMSARFLDGGRLLAFGRGQHATDAQHVSVEFVHPVIVGKRALPALDLSMSFSQWAPAIAGPRDIAMGFASPPGDSEITRVLADLRKTGVLTLALTGEGAEFSFESPSADAFIEQEIVEILYHTLWETVHVFFEHGSMGHEAGDAAFLYPFLGSEVQDLTSVTESVAQSIRAKASETGSLREQVASEQPAAIANAAHAIAAAVDRGGKVIVLGNGGSATDANDFALDCFSPPKSLRPLPAISLSMEPASITAIANDIGAEAIFLRQLIALAAPNDVVVVISTSGGSANVMAALEEAKKRRLPVVAILGYDGGEIMRRGLADFPVVVRSDYVPRIQEAHASIYHVMREMIDVIAHG
ncbi:MAG: SIS domain-containing protein [Gemmatimonadales bacterium]